MTCRELVELVTEYLDGAMPGAERGRFEAHIMKCSGCRAYLEQMRATVHATGRLEERDITGEARERLLAAFRDWRARPA